MDLMKFHGLEAMKASETVPSWAILMEYVRKVSGLVDMKVVEKAVLLVAWSVVVLADEKDEKSVPGSVDY